MADSKEIIAMPQLLCILVPWVDAIELSYRLEPFGGKVVSPSLDADVVSCGSGYAPDR